MTDSSLLIGDIGGTNARFALADTNGPGFSNLVTLRCADFPSAGVAINHYIETVGVPSPDIICLAVAGPVIDQRIVFTNSSWSIAANQLATDFSSTSVHLLNDFEAIAYSIPVLAHDDRRSIGPLQDTTLADDRYTVGILGPGTGLGMAGLKKYGGQIIPVAGEGSHSGFAPESQLQLDILTVLRERFERVSIERLVSGPGLENIYQALTQIHGEQRSALSAAEIFGEVEGVGDAYAVEAVQVFFEVLGQVAGDLALSLGVDRGVFVAGGIVRRYPQRLDSSHFRAGFENKGRYRSIMERIPTQLILHEQPGLLGASCVARQLLHDG